MLNSTLDQHSGPSPSKTKGSRRQVVFCTWKIEGTPDYFKGELANDPTLVPSSAPSLQGRITVTCFARMGILGDTVDLLGGIGFCHMDLFDADGMPFPMKACTEMLEMLCFYSDGSS